MDIKYVNINKIPSEGFLEEAFNHDLIIFVAASRIFKKSLMNSPKFGIVNYTQWPFTSL